MACKLLRHDILWSSNSISNHFTKNNSSYGSFMTFYAGATGNDNMHSKQK